MTTWAKHLDEAERARLADLKAERAALNAEYRKLYERAKKRGQRLTRIDI